MTRCALCNHPAVVTRTAFKRGEVEELLVRLQEVDVGFCADHYSALSLRGMDFHTTSRGSVP